MRNVGTFGVDANGKAASGLNHEGERTDATPRDGAPRSSEEVRESGRSEGGACSEAEFVGSTRNGRSPKDKAKPYCISRQEVLEAYLKVKSNKGAAGIDEQTIEDFEGDVKNNLYRIWNRMSSGSYFRNTDRVRSGSANGREESIGANGRPAIPFRLLRISPWEIGFGCSGAGSANVLGVRLGLRPGYQGLL